MLKPAFRICLLLCLLMTACWTVRAQEATATPPGPTLNSILSRGQVNCGVNQDLPGFGYLDPNTGAVSGFDVDFCRALGAAIFGDATAANLLLYSGDEGLVALQRGEIDVLFRNVTWTPTADVIGLAFGPVNFYNGQTIMVRAGSGLSDWEDLTGTTICVTNGTHAAVTLSEALNRRGVSAQVLPLDTLTAARDALADGQCDAQSADRVTLEVLRRQSGTADAFQVWEGAERLYSREPFAPLMRYGDEQWESIVRWTVLGLIQAEHLGLSSENIANLTQIDGETPGLYLARVGSSIAHFLYTSFGVPNNLGLAENFMVGVIREVGNYGEIYNRNLGTELGELRLGRDLNALAEDGGLLYAPDWR